MNPLWFAVGGVLMVLSATGVVLWRFRKTIPVEDYKKKYDDL